MTCRPGRDEFRSPLQIKRAGSGGGAGQPGDCEGGGWGQRSLAKAG